MNPPVIQWRHAGCRCLLLKAWRTPEGWPVELTAPVTRQAGDSQRGYFRAELGRADDVIPLAGQGGLHLEFDLPDAVDDVIPLAGHLEFDLPDADDVATHLEIVLPAAVDDVAGVAGRVHLRFVLPDAVVVWPFAQRLDVICMHEQVQDKAADLLADIDEVRSAHRRVTRTVRN